MIEGIILAAGASSRMGSPKAELSLPRGDTFLRRVVRSMLDGGAPRLVVVSGAAPEVVRRAWPERDVRVRHVHNPQWADGQLSSLLKGLDAVEVSTTEAVAVALVDVPLFAPLTLAHLVARWRETRAPIVRPARGHEHGHPVIFDRRVFAELRAADLALGAKTVVRAHAAELLDVPIDDPGAYRDFDYPEDLTEAKESP